MKIAFDPKIALSGARSEKTGSGDNEQQNLKQVCQDFESIFINTLFKEMRQSIPDDGYMEKSMDMELFEEMMDTEVARHMSRNGGLGIADALYRQFQGASLKGGHEDQ